MIFWRQHRRASRIARVMLLAWLFALVSSWANACLLQDHVPAHGLEHAGAEAPHEHAADHDHDADGARLVCQSVCDDEQSTLPTAATPTVPDLGPPSLVPIEPWSFCAAQARFPSVCPLAAAPPPEPSVAIRFGRMTI